MSDGWWPHWLYRPWNSPGQNTAVGSLSLLQGISPTQGSSPGIPHWRRILHQLSHQVSQRMLGWVAYPFSSRASLCTNWTDVYSFAGRIFPNWAIRKVLRWTKMEVRGPCFPEVALVFSLISVGILPKCRKNWERIKFKKDPKTFRGKREKHKH